MLKLDTATLTQVLKLGARIKKLLGKSGREPGRPHDRRPATARSRRAERISRAPCRTPTERRIRMAATIPLTSSTTPPARSAPWRWTSCSARDTAGRLVPGRHVGARLSMPRCHGLDARRSRRRDPCRSARRLGRPRHGGAAPGLCAPPAWAGCCGRPASPPVAAGVRCRATGCSRAIASRSRARSRRRFARAAPARASPGRQP